MSQSRYPGRREGLEQGLDGEGWDGAKWAPPPGGQACAGAQAL